MPARKPKTEDEPKERDRGPGPDQAVTLVSVWDEPKDDA